MVLAEGERTQGATYRKWVSYCEQSTQETKGTGWGQNKGSRYT